MLLVAIIGGSLEYAIPPEIWDNRACQALKLSIRWLQTAAGSSCFVLVLRKGFGEQSCGLGWCVPVMLSTLLRKDKCSQSFQMRGRTQPKHIWWSVLLGGRALFPLHHQGLQQLRCSGFVCHFGQGAHQPNRHGIMWLDKSISPETQPLIYQI